MNHRAYRGRWPAAVVLAGALAAIAVAPVPAVADDDDFAESRSAWAVAPPIGEHLQPGVARDGTLRVIRFSNDRAILNDPGTVVGFTAIVVRTGEIPKTHDEGLDLKGLLQIVRGGTVATD